MSLSYQKALPLLKIIIFLESFFVIIPIILLLYKSKGLSTGDFFLLQGIFGWIMVLLEIPTGYLGDILSRKKVLIISLFMWLIGSVYLIFAKGFMQILIVESLWAVAVSLKSGTIQAYLYDVLLEIHKEKENIKHQAEMDSLEAIAIGVSGILGGFMFAYDTMLPVYVECIIFALSLPLCFFLPEVFDSKRKISTGTSKMKDILNVTHYALKGHEEIKHLIWYQAFLLSGTLVLFWLIQGLMETYKFNSELFGIILFLIFISKSIFSKFVYKLTCLIGIKKIAVSLLPILLFSFISGFLLFFDSIYISWLVLIILIIPQIIVYGLASPVFTGLINGLVKSDERATILSISSMICRFLASIILIIMKPLTDNLGLNWAMLFAGMFFLMGIIPLVKLYRIVLFGQKYKRIF